MKTIFLLRHAKSSWDNSQLEDFDRPLSTRGEKSSIKIGKYIKNKNIIPDIVYCSSAKRAKKTWELINKVIKKKNNIFFKKDLYMADSETFMSTIKKTKNSNKSIMIVSHNPGIESFCLELSKENNEYINDIKTKYPTGSLAILKVNLKKWSEIRYESGIIYEFIKPRKL